MLASAKLLAIDNSIRCRVGWGNLNEEKISTFADNYLDNYRLYKGTVGVATVTGAVAFKVSAPPSLLARYVSPVKKSESSRKELSGFFCLY